MEEYKVMQDGSTARLTKSERYYVRHWGDSIFYYTLEGARVPLAKARCTAICKKIIKSKRCGDWVICDCGKSFVDTDRWFPHRHRYGGNAEPI